MSEPKKLENLLQEMNDRLEKIEKQSAPSQSTEQHTSFKQHSHSANVQFDCPDCQKAYDANIAAKALKEEHQKHLKLENPVLCKNCGEVVDEEEETCPSCHGTDARKI